MLLELEKKRMILILNKFTFTKKWPFSIKINDLKFKKR